MRRPVLVAVAAAATITSVMAPIAGARDASAARSRSLPSVSHVEVVPKAVSDTGGIVILEADVVRTKTYAIASRPPLPGLPETFKTTNRRRQVIHVSIHVPANPSHVVVHYALVLSATNSKGETRRSRVTFTVGAAPSPTTTTTTTTTTTVAPTTTTVAPSTTTTQPVPKVLYFTATPAVVPPAGGRVTLQGDTANPIGSCVVSQAGGPSVAQQLGAVTCSSPFSMVVDLPAAAPTVYTFVLTPDWVGFGPGSHTTIHSVTITVGQR